MEKVSFDFDSTLSRIDVQCFAKELIENGYDVWITTSRFEPSRSLRKDQNDDLFKIADKLGINRDKIIFTNFEDKYNFIHNDFIWHLDDDKDELDLINKHTKVIGISVFGNSIWRNKCLRLL